jgi:hypothetical protein
MCTPTLGPKPELSNSPSPGRAGASPHTITLDAFGQALKRNQILTSQVKLLQKKNEGLQAMVTQNERARLFPLACGLHVVCWIQCYTRTSSLQACKPQALLISERGRPLQEANVRKMHDRLRNKQIEELRQAVNSGKVENPGALAITEADRIAQKMRHYDATISSLKVCMPIAQLHRVSLVQCVSLMRVVCLRY